MEKVLVFHPKIDGPPVEMYRQQLDEIYAAKGWKLVVDSEDGSSDLTKKQLAEVAQDRGVDLGDAKTKGDIVQKLQNEVNK